MLPIIIFLAVAMLVGWLVTEFKAKPSIRIAAGVAIIACIAYAGFLAGRLHAAVEWAWQTGQPIVWF